MPRRPLARINGNRTIRKELTTYTRGLIIGKHESGVSMTHISQTLGIPLSTGHLSDRTLLYLAKDLPGLS